MSLLREILQEVQKKLQGSKSNYLRKFSFELMNVQSFLIGIAFPDNVIDEIDRIVLSVVERKTPKFCNMGA